MGKMRRLLAAILVTSMLFGTNGVSYAAEAIADSMSQETTTEETAEAVEEEVTESEKQTEVTDETVAENNESSSEQEEQDAVESASAEGTEVVAAEEEPVESASAEDTEVVATDEEAAQEETTIPATETETAPAAKAEEEKPAVKTEYTYHDDYVDVVATLQRADAVPDDAELVVTPVTSQTEGYKYEAYMEALNDQAEEVRNTIPITLCSMILPSCMKKKMLKAMAPEE